MAYTEQDSFAPSYDDDNSFGWTAAKQWVSHTFVPASSYTLSQLGVILVKITSYTGTLTAYIYSNGSSVPGSSLGTSTNTVAYGALPTSAGTYVLFQFGDIALTSGTTYWLVLASSNVSGSGVSVYADSSSQTGRLVFSADGATWADSNGYGNTIQGTIKTYITTGAATIIPQIMNLRRQFSR